VDPLLPRAPEVILGTLVYVTLLGVINAWLLWWSGSLLPGLIAALVFFAAYRMVAAVWSRACKSPGCLPLPGASSPSPCSQETPLRRPPHPGVTHTRCRSSSVPSRSA